MSTATQVYLKLQRLTEGQQQQVLDFVENLPPQAKRQLIDPYGIFANFQTSLSFEDFKKNRQEKWGDSTDKELE